MTGEGGAFSMTNKDVYLMIRRFIMVNKHAPSQKEIAEALGMAKSNVWGHLGRLEAKGAIEWDRFKHRGIRIRDWRYDE